MTDAFEREKTDGVCRLSPFPCSPHGGFRGPLPTLVGRRGSAIKAKDAERPVRDRRPTAGASPGALRAERPYVFEFRNVRERANGYMSVFQRTGKHVFHHRRLPARSRPPRNAIKLSKVEKGGVFG